MSTLARMLQHKTTHLFTASLDIMTCRLIGLRCSTNDVHQHWGYLTVNARQQNTIADCLTHQTSLRLMQRLAADGLKSISWACWWSKPRYMLAIYWRIKKTALTSVSDLLRSTGVMIELSIIVGSTRTSPKFAAGLIPDSAVLGKSTCFCLPLRRGWRWNEHLDRQRIGDTHTTRRLPTIPQEPTCFVEIVIADKE